VDSRESQQWRRVAIANADPAWIHALRFDQSGALLTAQERDDALDAARGDCTHVLVAAHGWNNGWHKALDRFRALFEGTLAYPQSSGPLRPVLIGLFWPSIWLTLPWEHGPALAADGLDDGDLADALSLLPAELRGPLEDAVATGPTDRAGAEAVARSVAHAVPSDDVTGEESPADADVVFAAWSAAAVEERLAPVRKKIGTAGPSRTHQPEAAARFWDPRDLVRLVSVWTMKDRAGQVGRGDAATFLDELTGATSAPVHLVGHSYGARLLLSAMVARHGREPVTSMLLLQPAVNHLCFATHLPGGGTGGYRAALEDVKQPLLTTYSEHDRALTKHFHRALRRNHDLGEAVPAPWPYPPSPYAALGGYGPGEMGGECTWRALPAATESHALDDGRRVHALDGSAAITDHGDVTNAPCCWALRAQMDAASGAAMARDGVADTEEVHS
jgi:hypothetical protein